jgi:hypothetical protein
LQLFSQAGKECWWWNSYKRNHSDIRSVLQNTKKLYRAIQNKRHGMLSSGVVLLHDRVHLHTCTTACTQALLEHFNWELFDHPSYSPDLAPSNDLLFTYLKCWLGSQRSWWKVSEHGWAHRWQTSLTQAYKSIFPDVTGASVPVVTSLRSSLSMHIFFSHCLFC